MATEEAKQEMQRLVAKYEGLGTRAIKGYNEANTKDGFIRPLFEALGWDFSNLDEVEGEKTITPGRVDYLVKVNGVSKFCLEVKALHVDINDERWIRQAITYAYYKGVTWAVLTNFRALRAFNAQRETRDIRQIAFLSLACEDYLTDFHRLWLLSREAVASGDLDKEAVAYGRLPPRLPVEKRLYDKLTGWRETLFNEVYLHYKDVGFTWSQVDQWIQQLLNRLIFIRTAEDRGLIDKTLLATLHQWQGSGGKGDLMDRLRDIFHEFAQLYDSELFPQIMDPWDSVSVYNSGALADIVQGLYEVPGGLADWDFATIGSDVLGTVYEQYLGYVPARVKVEAKEAQQRLFPAEPHIGLSAKKEKRKGEGIYYTPRWVVDYIVKQTVGRYIEEHSHNDILNIRILDPACGSGSFLTRAYEELLNYHARQQGKSPAELDQSERTRILLRNIYGVDLDQQAVEIARLSLLLCSLSGQETLPSLANNIRRGNSLISGADEELRPYFGDEWEEKHRFNWKEEFPQIMADGGFDVVIGNPPYVRIQTLPREDADYYRDKYESAFGSFDIYVLFLEKGTKLLKPGGRLGFITSGKFLKAKYGKRIQQLLRENCVVENIVDLSAQQVFADATTYPAIVVLRKGIGDELLRYTAVPRDLLISGTTQPVDLAALPAVQASQEAVVKGVWPPISAVGDSLLEKLSADAVPLGEIADRIFQGLITSADKVYILEKRGEPKEGVVKVYSRALEQEYELESALLKPLLTGKNVSRYYSVEPRQLLLFPYHISQGKASLIDESVFASQYPNAWEYLNRNREILEQREGGKFRGRGWYAFGRTQNLALHDRRKMAIPRLVKRLAAVYDQTGNFYLDNVDVGGLILKEGSDAHYLYILGLLNSLLLNFYFQRISLTFRGGFYSANRQFLEPLPIRRIDFENPEEKKMHDKLVALVERMLELNKRLAPICNTPCNERDELEREIERTDRQIDNLVYDLYGLTEEERRIVEAEGKTEV